MATIPAAYQAREGSILDVNKAFYDRLAELTGDRELVESFVIPIRSGRAWEVPAGRLCRILPAGHGQASSHPTDSGR